MPSFTHQLNIIARCSQTQRTKQLKPLGLCGGQVPYLLRLCREPGITQEALARAVCVNKSTAARQVSALEKNGFLERRPCETDRRRQCLYPTEKALSARPAVLSCLTQWSDYLLEELTPQERETVETILTRVALRAQNYLETEGGWEE